MFQISHFNFCFSFLFPNFSSTIDYVYFYVAR